MKKTLTILLLLVLCLSIKAPSIYAEWDSHFVDVSPNNSHYSNIYYLADLGVIKGYSDYTFKPSNYVTNRQVAVMLVRALDLENEKYSDPGFKDVTKRDSAYKDIAIATQKGFFLKSTNFKPDEYITRESMAFALTKAFNLTGTSTMTFSDVPSNHLAYLSVQALAANNITTGSNGKFNPKDKLTRAQFASFLTRAILPAARPLSTIYKYGYGLVPTKYGSTYIYSEYYEMANNLHVFDSVYDHSRFIENSRTTIMEGTYNSEIDHASRIEYFENLTRFNISVSMPYVGAELELNYPIKDGTKYTKRDFDQYGNNVKWDYTVLTTNGIHKAGGKIYTSVVIIDELKYFDSDSPMHTTYYLVKDIGLIAFDTELGRFNLVSVK